MAVTEVKRMEYKRILEVLAKKYNTTVDEIQKSMDYAIIMSNFNISAETVVNNCAEMIKSAVNSN